MTATNHILSGAVIGIFIKEPAFALPLAFASHFIFDALPHFGLHTWQQRQKHKKLFAYTLALEIFGSLGVILFLVLSSASWLVILCGLVAYSPDIAWGYRFIFAEKMGTKPPPHANRFNQFHTDIQKYESINPGGLIEVLFLAACSIIMITQLS